jgi:hypothetical protein
MSQRSHVTALAASALVMAMSNFGESYIRIPKVRRAHRVRGNKYALCACGSREVYAKCCMKQDMMRGQDKSH